MRDGVKLLLCDPEPRLYYENGQIAVTDGHTVWRVIVTCEAMMATARPPERSLRRLVRYARFYRDLAATAIRRGEDLDGRVMIRETDVLAAISRRPGHLGRRLRGSRHRGWRLATERKGGGNAQSGA